MLNWTQPQVIEGVTVYTDHEQNDLYYLLPATPRFRMDQATKKPVFRFLKYRNPIERTNPLDPVNPNFGGGFLIADVEFVVDEIVKPKVVAKLQEQHDQQFANENPKKQVRIGELNFVRGAASITILDSGGALVQKIRSPANPSLYGQMITPFTAELSDRGATLLEQALQGDGGVVQVVYDLWLPVRLPEMIVTVWFEASKYMNFHQDVDIDWSFWGDDEYRETIRETFRNSDSGGVEIEPGGVSDPKIIAMARDWGFQTLEEAVKRMELGEIASVSADDRKVPEDIEHVHRDFTVDKASSFRRTYKEGAVMEWNPGPRGTLPNITSMKGPDGQAFQWKDFSTVVDLDDPFFKTLLVNARVNADFASLPIDSVDLTITYDKGATHRTESYSFLKPEDIGKFESFIEGNDWKYKYKYKVNYKGQARNFESKEIITEDRELTINVGDTGILQVRGRPGDINWDQVNAVQVTMKYEDSGNNVDPIEEIFTLTKDQREFKFERVIFSAVEQPYKYRPKYMMQGGKEYQGDEATSRSPSLVINDPFAAQKMISIRALGDLDTDIANIFIDLKYEDATNNYRQDNSIALNKAAPFFNWSFPVISETTGTVKFSGTIVYKNGESENIAEKTAAGNTIFAGPVDVLRISADPALLDFTNLRLVKVNLHYTDPANGVDERKEFLFRKNTDPTVEFMVRMKNKNKTDYEYSAVFFLTDGTSKTVGPITKSDQLLLVDMPA